MIAACRGELGVGSVVEAKYLCSNGRITDEWYTGRVRQRNDDGTYWVDYDEGGFWWGDAPEHFVRAKQCTVATGTTEGNTTTPARQTKDSGALRGNASTRKHVEDSRALPVHAPISLSDATEIDHASHKERSIPAENVRESDVACVDELGSSYVFVGALEELVSHGVGNFNRESGTVVMESQKREISMPPETSSHDNTSEATALLASSCKAASEPLERHLGTCLQLHLRRKGLRPHSAPSAGQRDIPLPSWLSNAQMLQSSSSSPVQQRPRSAASCPDSTLRRRGSMSQHDGDHTVFRGSMAWQRTRSASTVAALSRANMRSTQLMHVSIKNLPKPVSSTVWPAKYYTKLVLPSLKSLAKSASSSRRICAGGTAVQMSAVRRVWSPQEGAYHLEVEGVEVARRIVRVTHGVKCFGKQLSASFKPAAGFAGESAVGGDSSSANCVPLADAPRWFKVLDTASGHFYYSNGVTSQWEPPV